MLLLRLASLCKSTLRLPPIHRSYSTQQPPILSPNHAIYISNSSNPYFNLTLEDWLFRHKDPKDPLLLIYRDNPCVVIGRNQNPWKEVNLVASTKTGVPFIRRRSGGGTVYHDLGNTNFSIHLPRSSFDRHVTAQVVLRAVRSLGVADANVNDRNDICVGTDKISYKIVNNRAYHHGTMLISTRLDMLGDLLRTNKNTMETKGVASVRSSVRNLQQYNSTVTHEAFVDAMVSSFKEEYEIDESAQIVEETDQTTSIEYIRHGMEELPGWHWAFGQTPEFTYTIENTFEWGAVEAKIHSKHGVILDCELTSEEDGLELVGELKEVSARLKGQKYGFVDDYADELQTFGSEVWRWFQTEMST